MIILQKILSDMAPVAQRTGIAMEVEYDTLGRGDSEIECIKNCTIYVQREFFKRILE